MFCLCLGCHEIEIMNMKTHTAKSRFRPDHRDIKSRIAIIDDVEDICRMLGKFLRYLGYDV